MQAITSITIPAVGQTTAMTMTNNTLVRIRLAASKKSLEKALADVQVGSDPGMAMERSLETALLHVNLALALAQNQALKAVRS